MAWCSDLDQVGARLVDLVCMVNSARKLNAGDACCKKAAHEGVINHW